MRAMHGSSRRGDCDVLIVLAAILVVALAATVGMLGVPLAKDAGQSTGDGRVGEAIS